MGLVGAHWAPFTAKTRPKITTNEPAIEAIRRKWLPVADSRVSILVPRRADGKINSHFTGDAT
jgi:hypothetical protein